jgi:hypothetical protein
MSYSFIPFLLLAIYMAHDKKETISILGISFIILIYAMVMYFLYVSQISHGLVFLFGLLGIVVVTAVLILRIDKGLLLYTIPLFVPVFLFSLVSNSYALNSLIVGFYLMLAATLAALINAYYPKNRVTESVMYLKNEISRYGPGGVILILLFLLLISLSPLWPTYLQKAVPAFVPSYITANYYERFSFLPYPYYISDYCPIGKNSSLQLNISANNEFDVFLINVANGTSPLSVYGLLSPPNLSALASRSAYNEIGVKKVSFNHPLENCMMLIATNGTYANTTAFLTADTSYFVVSSYHANAFTTVTTPGTGYGNIYNPTVYVLNGYANATDRIVSLFKNQSTYT